MTHPGGGGIAVNVAPLGPPVNRPASRMVGIGAMVGVRTLAVVVRWHDGIGVAATAAVGLALLGRTMAIPVAARLAVAIVVETDPATVLSGLDIGLINRAVLSADGARLEDERTSLTAHEPDRRAQNRARRHENECRSGLLRHFQGGSNKKDCV